MIMKISPRYGLSIKYVLLALLTNLSSLHQLQVNAVDPKYQPPIGDSQPTANLSPLLQDHIVRDLQQPLITPPTTTSSVSTLATTTTTVTDSEFEYALKSFSVQPLNATSIEVIFVLPLFAIGRRGKAELFYAGVPLSDPASEQISPPENVTWFRRQNIRTANGTFPRQTIKYHMGNLKPSHRYWFRLKVHFQEQEQPFDSPLESLEETVVMPSEYQQVQLPTTTTTTTSTPQPPSTVSPSSTTTTTTTTTLTSTPDVSADLQSSQPSTTTIATIFPTLARAIASVVTTPHSITIKPVTLVTPTTTVSPPTTTTTSTKLPSSSILTPIQTNTSDQPASITYQSSSIEPTIFFQPSTTSSTTTTTTSTTTTTTSAPSNSPIADIQNTVSSSSIIPSTSTEMDPLSFGQPLTLSWLEQTHQQLNAPLQRYALHLLTALVVMTLLFLTTLYKCVKNYSRIGMAPITPYSAYENQAFTTLVNFYSKQNYQNDAREKNLEVDKTSPFHGRHHVNGIHNSGRQHLI